MQSVSAVKMNEVYATLDSDELFILKELVDYFTYEVPGAKFMPAYKNKIWDGKIRLFNPVNRKIYVGLLSQVKSFCERNDYGFEYFNEDNKKEFTDENLKELAEYVSPKSGGKSLTYRDYQLEAVQTAINKDRCLLLSPTASGKSLIIYTLIRFYLLHPEIQDKKILIVVPTTSLVSQMYKDFEDYGYDVEKNCHMIYQGSTSWLSLGYAFLKPFFFLFFFFFFLSKSKLISVLLLSELFSIFKSSISILSRYVYLIKFKNNYEFKGS